MMGSWARSSVDRLSIARRWLPPRRLAKSAFPTSLAVGGCGTRMTAGKMMTTSTTMADLARNLSPIAGRSIVDGTGLTGSFDVDLTWAPDPDAPGDSASLFTTMQEQLGLKLDSQRAPIETLVIDSAERPTED
jgi:uncharacterized protein (TIGR03435 family)